MKSLKRDLDSTHRNRRLSIFLLFVGMIIAVVGVIFSFQLQRIGLTTSSSDPQFTFLEHAFLPTLGIGLLLMFIGGVMWARDASPKWVALSGFACATGAFVSGELTPINIHGWTVTLMFLYVGVVGLGLTFVVLAALRYSSTHGKGGWPT